ncbi:hypothetical protein RRG08_006658 [Elysia crispata]|uniref:Uncharacterized protein n=1 Tax=Elysia crispata TaxID=231223 RepID=A0AAE0YXL6_9GAST|nr:hypothetical protein RRG08_006658 [Elysia crispata]
MLAHNGLALITEKLQNQRLEEPAQPSPAAAKLPVGYDNTTKPATQQQTSLAVKGKNVWALTVESERPGRQSQQSHEFNSQDMLPRPPTLRRPVAEKTPSLSVQIPAACCRHKKLRQACYVCESAPGTPTAPPKKKHCRSLSVPPDSGFGNQSPSLTSREPASRLWKPIALNPLTNYSRGSGGANSSWELGKRQPGVHSCLATSDNLSPIHPASGESSGRGSGCLPNLLGSNLQHIPPSASAASSDSGHFTTSDFQTPPGSPVPTAATRPASASSDTASSFSSMGSAWLEFAGGNGGGNSSISSQTLRGARALQNRSLSCEDRISGSSSSFSYTSSAAASTISMPCVHAGVLGSMEACCPKSCSDFSGSSRCRSGSQDSSSAEPVLACTSSIPRCHSQPCVLHHRRCGKKRRRNCDRPTLNFNKMTETAYMRGGNRRSEPWSTPVVIHQPSVSNHQKRLEASGGICSNSTNTSRLSFVLNPIASSPLDSEFPLVDTSGDLDLRHAASVALPLTPPDQSSPTFFLARPGSMKQEDHEEEEEEDGEESDHTNCHCHDRHTDDGVGLVFPMVDLDLEQIENH